MNYMRSVRYVFDQPNWLTNVLLGVLCQFIPVIGGIVWMGYQFDVVEGLQQSRDQRAPDFNFNRFMPYLTRGLWPFLVSLVVMLPVILLLWVVMFAAMGLIGSAGSSEGLGPMLTLLLFGLVFALIVTILFLVNLLVLPMSLRAGLAQEFALAADWAFMKAFHERALRELIWSQLFMLGVSLAAMFAGLLLCCIGIYPAMVVVSLAQAHLLYQLYALYLERGGPPVPLKVESVVAAPGRY